jgi:diacylglycerol kinase family enzyme
MLGAGFDAAVVATLDLGLKRRIGRGAYVWQSLRMLPRYDFARCAVTLDGEDCMAASVVVTKGRLYAGHYLLAPRARPDAPGFQVALLQDAGRLRSLLAGLALPLDLLPRLPGLTLRPARHVVLHGAALPVQMDGDPVGTLPVEVTDAPAPIAVLVPRGSRFTRPDSPEDAPACPIAIP